MKAPTDITEKVPVPRAVKMVIAGIHKASGAAAVLSTTVSLAIMIGIIADFSSRTITGRSLPGLLELVETFMVIVVYMALAQGERNKVHMRLDSVTDRLSVRIRYIVRAFAMVIATFGAGCYVYATSVRALSSLSYWEYRPGLLNFPVWPSRILIVVGFSLLLLESLVTLFEYILLAIHPQHAPKVSNETNIEGMV
ncbi:MAG: TRAP transporter small permease [Propionibacteriaceae bacterium]|nr:TRAP transporter small permease [Propionibacteriaceae bacterium]